MKLGSFLSLKYSPLKTIFFKGSILDDMKKENLVHQQISICKGNKN